MGHSGGSHGVDAVVGLPLVGLALGGSRSCPWVLLGLWCNGGACNVAEGDGIGHLERQASGKGTDLLMNVHEESVRLPAPHFANCFGVNAIEVHGHCSS